jgi:hypothetical protein
MPRRQRTHQAAKRLYGFGCFKMEEVLGYVCSIDGTLGQRKVIVGL